VSRKRIFFATDIHASEKTFRKFLNAPKFYKADALILGGDLTGKMTVPVVEQSDGSYKCSYLGNEVVVKSNNELEALKSTIRNNGYYYYQTTQDEYEDLQADPAKTDKLIQRLMLETLSSWVRIADETLGKTNIKCYVTGGNDDPFSIDAFFESCNSNSIVYCEGKVVELNEHEMVSSGYSNVTPWKCPRDIPDEELAKRLKALCQTVKAPARSIFNIHAPPYDSALDTAYLVNENLEFVKIGGQPVLAPVGSKAVRSAIEEFQPLVGLHGHIHESRGVCKVGKTVCLNPGSEYGEGILRGVLIFLEEDKLLTHQFVSG
jgi:Icc-related predicted phosphoesterase